MAKNVAKLDKDLKQNMLLCLQAKSNQIFQEMEVLFFLYQKNKKIHCTFTIHIFDYLFSNIEQGIIAGNRDVQFIGTILSNHIVILIGGCLFLHKLTSIKLTDQYLDNTLIYLTGYDILIIGFDNDEEYEAAIKVFDNGKKKYPEHKYGKIGIRNYSFMYKDNFHFDPKILKKISEKKQKLRFNLGKILDLHQEERDFEMKYEMINLIRRESILTKDYGKIVKKKK